MSEPTSVVKHSAPMMVSAEVLADALDMQAAILRWFDATPEQWDQWRREAVESRAFERAAAPVQPVDLAALLDRLGWSQEYAHHFVQPYCTCGPHVDDGWYRCPHAEDVGLHP